MPKTINHVIIGAIIATLLGSGQIAAASVADRPAINPDFDPDESCIIDIFQDKCDPGTEGECPEGFGQNEDGLCTQRTLVDGEWRWLCPEGYHSAWENETGQCYPNDEGCQDDGFILVEEEDEYKNDQCAPLYTICDEEEVRNEDFCIEYCEENPDSSVCKPEATTGHLFCDGKPRNYAGLSDLPKLEEGECYGTCEVLSKGLACDIEKIS